MSVLVIAEHDNAELKPATLNTVAAAAQLGDVDILVAGENCNAVANTAAKIAGVGRVLKADASALKTGLAENVAPLIVQLSSGYSHILAPATTNGKNIMPRVAALLDVAQISEITSVVSADTFVRPIYAGNAMATVQSADAIKIITVRTTGFDAAPAEGGSAALEDVSNITDAALSSFAGQELTVSERPELTSAKVVISGGRGMQSGENFPMLEEIADKLGAAVVPVVLQLMPGSFPMIIKLGKRAK